jgi:hypothetical protein
MPQAGFQGHQSLQRADAHAQYFSVVEHLNAHSLPSSDKAITAYMFSLRGMQYELVKKRALPPSLSSLSQNG